MAIDPDFSVAAAGLRPEDALTPTVEFLGAAPIDEAPIVTGGGHRRIGPYLAVAWMIFIVIIAFFHSVLPLARSDVIVGPPKQSPCFCLDEPFGTDTVGRSVTSRLALGARQSLVVAVVSVAIGFVVGGTVG